MKKRLHSLIFAGLALIACQTMSAQEPAITNRGCASMEYKEREEKANPSIKALRAQIDQQVEQYVANQKVNPTTKAVVTIPIVFHIVYNTAAQNVTDFCIAQTLIALNQDFRKQNADFSTVTPSVFQPLGADCEIQFCMASVDPTGAPTTGITRTSTSVTAFDNTGPNPDAIKFTSQGGKNIWDRDKYVNLWVCNLGSGLLGYATFPGAPAAQDGVVCHYRYLVQTGGCGQTPFEKGRTTVHELGHWFGLYHIWGDATCGNDLVADTPTQQNASGGCPVFPTVTCSNGPNGNMHMNYMDYTNDACMVMFSAGQKTRMQAILNGTRSSLLTSAATKCATAALDAGINSIVSPAGQACNTTFTPIVKLQNYGATTLTSCTISYRIDNNANQTYNWSGSLASASTVNVTLPIMTTTAGTHTFTSFSSSPNSSTDGNAGNDQSTATFTVSSAAQSLPIVQGLENATFPPSGWTINNSDAGLTWQRSTSAARSGSASMYMDNYDYQTPGEVDEFVSLPMNFSGATTGQLTFEVAYQMYTNPTDVPNFSDTLKVLVSTDCGVTWTTAYTKYGTALTTITPTFSSNEFIPNSSQWRLETINLTSYLPASNLMIKFRHTTSYENNMYIDDINISSVVGVNEIDISNYVSIYPNPSSGDINVSINAINSGNVNVKVLNMLGEVVAEGSDNAHKFSFNLSGQSSGVYFVKVETENGNSTKKILLNK